MSNHGWNNKPTFEAHCSMICHDIAVKMIDCIPSMCAESFSCKLGLLWFRYSQITMGRQFHLIIEDFKRIDFLQISNSILKRRTRDGFTEKQGKLHSIECKENGSIFLIDTDKCTIDLFTRYQ